MFVVAMVIVLSPTAKPAGKLVKLADPGPEPPADGRAEETRRQLAALAEVLGLEGQADGSMARRCLATSTTPNPFNQQTDYA